MENKKIEQSLAVVKNELATIAELGDLKITGKPSLDLSAEGLKAISKVSKAIKTEKDSWIAPLKEQIERHKERYLPFEQRVAEIERHIKAEQGAYLTRLRKEEAEAKAKADAEIAEKMKDGEDVSKDIEKAGKKLEKIEAKSDTIKTFTYTGVKILDKSKIPLQFLDVNTSALLEALKTGLKVEGAELYTEERVRR
jgi:hypothetical protein